MLMINRRSKKFVCWNWIVGRMLDLVLIETNAVDKA